MEHRLSALVATEPTGQVGNERDRFASRLFPQVKDEGVTTWVRPSLVVRVKFADWTSKGELRQPVYLGLRSDKKPLM